MSIIEPMETTENKSHLVVLSFQINSYYCIEYAQELYPCKGFKCIINLENVQSVKSFYSKMNSTLLSECKKQITKILKKLKINTILQHCGN